MPCGLHVKVSGLSVAGVVYELRSTRNAPTLTPSRDSANTQVTRLYAGSGIEGAVFPAQSVLRTKRVRAWIVGVLFFEEVNGPLRRGRVYVSVFCSFV